MTMSILSTSISNFQYGPPPETSLVAADADVAAISDAAPPQDSGADLSDQAMVLSAQELIAALTDAQSADPVTAGSLVDQLV